MSEEPPIIIEFIETPEEKARNLELRRRQELRSNALVPIYFFHTSDIPEAEARAAFLGVQDALLASGQDRQLINFGSSSYQTGNGEYSSPDWYINEAGRRQSLRRNAGYGPQIDVSEIMYLFPQEPWQETPHWEVFLVNTDLNDRDRDGQYINFVFGSTNMLFPASVQSIRRLMDEVQPGPLREAMVRRLLRHEVGHMFGLPSYNRAHTEEKLGSHCTNVCAMRQGMSTREWASLTIEEENKGIHFCADCMRDLESVKDKYRPLAQ